MKKIIVTILVLVMLLVMLTGCVKTHDCSKTTELTTGEVTYRIDGEIVSESVWEMFSGKGSR